MQYPILSHLTQPWLYILDNNFFNSFFFQSYLFLLGCGLLTGAAYTVFTSLITPVLSDQFGFTVKYTSYFFLAVSATYLMTSFVQ